MPAQSFHIFAMPEGVLSLGTLGGAESVSRYIIAGNGVLSPFHMNGLVRYDVSSSGRQGMERRTFIKWRGRRRWPFADMQQWVVF